MKCLHWKMRCAEKNTETINKVLIHHETYISWKYSLSLDTDSVSLHESFILNGHSLLVLWQKMNRGVVRYCLDRCNESWNELLEQRVLEPNEQLEHLYIRMMMLLVQYDSESSSTKVGRPRLTL